MLPAPKYAPVKAIYGGTFDIMLMRISDKLHAGVSLIEVKVWIGRRVERLEPREHRQLLIDACHYWADLVAAGIPQAPPPVQTTIKA